MTPDQQSALESLVGRVLSSDEVALLDQYLPTRNDVEIANILSVGRIRVDSKQIGIGTILMALSPHGGIFLDQLVELGQTDRNVYWSFELIRAGTFDIGLPGTREQLIELKNEFPAVGPALDILMKTAESPDPIPYGAVSDALNIAERQMTL